MARALAAGGKRWGAGHVEHATWAWAAGRCWAAAHPRPEHRRGAGIRPALPDLSRRRRRPVPWSGNECRAGVA